ncbi:uncharacterized protein LODBEIA_P35760 [Lodderomyces beijingensis]|uniref:Altered inheritance of mitochondria protein 6 n=1 Tax=Lodderomyces beijingensis TaxID=1775926 RepID=A0ABP0ZPT4_9ASCO
MMNVYKQLQARDDAGYNNSSSSASSILNYDGHSSSTPVLPFNYTIEGLTRDVYPKPLHSHNDYWRKHPLFDALSVGAVSIESDIWYFPKSYTLQRTTTESTGITTTPNETLYFRDDEVYVGHNQVFLHPIRTIFNLYLNPLFQFLQYSNPKFTYTNGSGNALLGDQAKHSVFYNDPEQQVYLWFDIKTEPNSTYDALKPHLKPFIDAGYLTYYNTTSDTLHQGPVILTITGNLPVEKVQAEQVRYFFLDAPLGLFNSSTNETTLKNWGKLSRVASGGVQNLLGNDYNSTLRNDYSEAQKVKLKGLFDTAHQYGLKTRVWGDVTWPWNLVDSHLKTLFALGSDVLNVDDLKRANDLFPN